MRIAFLIMIAVLVAPSLAQAQEAANQPTILRIRVVLPESISEEEAGLTAWLDGRLLGDLPGEFQFRPGTYKLYVKQRGVRVGVKTIHIPNGGSQIMNLKFAALRVEGDFEFRGATILVNGTERDRVPATILVPANYTLQLGLRTSVPMEKELPGRIRLRPGETLTHRARMKPRYFDSEGNPRPSRFNDSGISHWDPIILELMLFPSQGVAMRLGTYNWKYLRFSILDFSTQVKSFAGGSMEYLYEYRVGPTIGFGGQLGSRKQYGAWVFTGAWYGRTEVPDFWTDWFDDHLHYGNSYSGLFLPIGAELTHHFGRHLDWVWGFRLFGAFSPFGRRERNGECPSVESCVGIPFVRRL